MHLHLQSSNSVPGMECVQLEYSKKDFSHQDLYDLSLTMGEGIQRDKVTELDLSSNLLTSLPQNVSFSFSNLQSLDISSNMVSELPPGFCTLLKLQTLNLKKNRLKCLPERFGDLKGLRKLNLSGNWFQQFPVQLCVLDSLEYLHLGGNSIANVPPSIKNLLL